MLLNNLLDVVDSSPSIFGPRFVFGSRILRRVLIILKEMTQLSFDHVLNLSFAWHLRRKTGEVLRILDRGVAVNRILEVRYIFDNLTSTD